MAAVKSQHSMNGIFKAENICHSAVFATLSNETRLRCLHLAARYQEVCVCEAVDALGIAQPSVSKAFKALKQAGLVADRRDANWTYYRLNESAPGWIAEVIATTVAELERSGAYEQDVGRFERSRSRSEVSC